MTTTLPDGERKPSNTVVASLAATEMDVFVKWAGCLGHGGLLGAR